MFKVMPTKEICKQQLKITLDPEHAKCAICLQVRRVARIAFRGLHALETSDTWYRSCMRRAPRYGDHQLGGTEIVGSELRASETSTLAVQESQAEISTPRNLN